MRPSCGVRAALTGGFSLVEHGFQGAQTSVVVACGFSSFTCGLTILVILHIVELSFKPTFSLSSFTFIKILNITHYQRKNKSKPQ